MQIAHCDLDDEMGSNVTDTALAFALSNDTLLGPLSPSHFAVPTLQSELVVLRMEQERLADMIRQRAERIHTFQTAMGGMKGEPESVASIRSSLLKLVSEQETCRDQ